jgi:hypothetical protein
MDQERIAYNQVSPDGVHAMRQLEEFLLPILLPVVCLFQLR